MIVTKMISCIKVRNLIDYMIVVSRSLYNPEKVLTVDEAMIKFNGRSKLKVYMPLKPTKYGFKAYILAEASSGFVLNWQLHNGKRNSLISILDNLTDPFAGQGYRISMDRFYTTLSTVSNLTEKGFEVLACITKNRAKLTSKMQNEIDELQKGESKFYCSTNNEMLLTVWSDSKMVYLVSNIGTNSVGEVSRNIKQRDSFLPYEKDIISSPNTIKDYSKSARGVDYLDQMMSYYSTASRSKKWYMSIVCHLLEMCLHNSFVLYCKAKRPKLSYLDFRKSIIESLFSNLKENKIIEKE